MNAEHDLPHRLGVKCAFVWLMLCAVNLAHDLMPIINSEKSDI